MKRIFLYGALLISPMSVAWTDISRSAYQPDLFVDQKRFSNESAWIKSFINSEHWISKINYSCEQNTLDYEKIYLYKNNKLDSVTENVFVGEVIPGTYGEYVLNSICEYKAYNNLSEKEQSCVNNFVDGMFIKNMVNLCYGKLKLNEFNISIDESQFQKSHKQLDCDKYARKKLIEVSFYKSLRYAFEPKSLMKNELVNYCYANIEKFNFLYHYWDKFK